MALTVWMVGLSLLPPHFGAERQTRRAVVPATEPKVPDRNDSAPLPAFP
jgi:hypothetical protein